MKKLSCLIIEDEPNAAELIARYIERVPFLSCNKICYNGFEALDYLKTTEIDLIFLDINLPELSGLDIASMLQPNQKIIFTTAYAEYALHSFSFFVVDYLLKPITFKRFMQAALKAQEIFDLKEEETGFIYIKNGHQHEKIFYDDILYIEGMREYACIYTAKSAKLIYKRMKDLSNTLPNQFLRVHNSFIVNTLHVTSAKTNEIILNEKKIPISVSYKNAVQQWLANKRI